MVATIDIALVCEIPYLDSLESNVIVASTVWRYRSPDVIRTSGIFALDKIRNVPGYRSVDRWPDHLTA